MTTLTIDIKKKVLATSLLFMIAVPIFAHGEDIIVDPRTTPDPGTGITYVCDRGKPGECDFQDVILAVQKILRWARDFALFFSVIVLVIAGFKYMISGDNPGERTKANEMFKKVAIGIFFVMAAWLIVTLITNALLKDGVSTIIQDNNPQL